MEAEELARIKYYALQLFEKGTELAQAQGLILADTKYEFGYQDEDVYVIDEIHTPDSPRYFYLDGYAERQAAGEAQKQLSKEFVRKWLMANGFQGLEGQQMPHMDDAFVDSITDRYIELYDTVTGKPFVKAPVDHLEERIMDHTLPVLKQLLS